MTRSRIFLGLTAGALAIAGAIAAKANTGGSAKGFYITSGPDATCVSVTTTCVKGASANTCRTLGGTKFYTAKTTGGACNTNKPLHYTAQ